MLFLLFGSSAAGKTAALQALRGRVAGLELHDFDELPAPPGADTAWRHDANEVWVRRALDLQAAGTDLLLAGQTPLGELLAAPPAASLEAISACLLDCNDDTRTARMLARGPEWLVRTGGQLKDYLAWAEWMRGHAADPGHEQHVIRVAETEDAMRWERWCNWQRGDPRWRVLVIDTAALSVERVAQTLTGWIADERALVREGRHPLGAARVLRSGREAST